jgi:threonine/homoserine/homoserine lactone efflux protein
VRGLAAVMGVAVGMGLLMFVAGIGVGTTILGNAIVMTTVKGIGALVMCWMAWKIATARTSGVEK